MLAIKTKSDMFEFYVGQTDLFVSKYDIASNTEWVQADGDELYRIRAIWGNNTALPFPDKRVVRWYGDFAKMIVANW